MWRRAAVAAPPRRFDHDAGLWLYANVNQTAQTALHRRPIAEGFATDYTSVWAPRSLLLDPNLTPSAKIIWLLIRLPQRPGVNPIGCKKASNSVGLLAERAGLTRHTVRSSLKQLKVTKWLLPGGGFAGRPVDGDVDATVPRDLLLDRWLGEQSKVLYCVLKTLQRQFHYADLSELTGASINTLKHAVDELVEGRWLQVAQQHQHAPVHFTLFNPVEKRRRAAIKEAKLRISTAPSIGEGLMREYLSLLVDSSEFVDGGNTGLLPNELTGMLLQFDRYYLRYRVAFEFNGPQHVGATALFTSEQSAKQQARDQLKLITCPQIDVTLVVVVAEDLSLAGMRQKVGKLLPLRRIQENELILDFLEWRSERYRQEAQGKEEW